MCGSAQTPCRSRAIMAAPSSSTPGGRIRKTLAPLAAAGADAGQIAGEAVAAWDAIHRAMAPVIGPRGSAALFHRTLHLGRATYPWLAAPCDTPAEPGDFGPLQRALASQAAAEAAAAHDAMLLAFLDLLATLIGEPLTARLLQGAGEPPSDDISSQEPLR